MVAVAAGIAAAKPATTEAALYGGSGGGDGCCVDFLVCLLRALGVNPASTEPAQFKWAARPLRRKRSSPRVAPADPELRDAPARIAGNGACATASLYTMQGKKGVNQDAMVVMEVCLSWTPRPDKQRFELSRKRILVQKMAQSFVVFLMAMDHKAIWFPRGSEMFSLRS